MYWANLVAEHSDVWMKGLAGKALSATEAAAFEALAAALELNYYSAWNSSNLLGEQLSERWVRAAASEFYTYPGLMAFWRRESERQLRTDPGATKDPWLISVNAEIDRLIEEGG
jgi:hypothetical protein